MTHPLAGLKPDRSTVDRLMLIAKAVQSVTATLDLSPKPSNANAERKLVA